MTRFDRRSALRLLGGAAGAVGAVGAPMLYACGGRDERPLSESIDTVVLLMMENRSFDNYYGAMSMVEGRRGLDGLLPSMKNPDLAGEAVAVHPADLNCIADPRHSWTSSHRQFNEGKNDGFVTEHERRYGFEERHRPMGYFDRRTLPAHYGIGGHYTICDRWFSSLMTSTWPNRFYTLGAQNNGIRGNDFEGDYSFINIYDRLGRAGIPWSVYYGNISFSSLFPRKYPQDNFRELMRFFDDAEAGTLPNFVMVEPIYGRNDDHPPEHPLAGQVLIQAIYDALAKSPQWERSLFIVTYDEHGGFFDHVAPPKVPDLFADDGFDQLGFRVPAFVAGPFVKQGHVEHTVFDHTSVLAFVERLWGLNPLTPRDAAANDLSVLLDERRLRDDRPAAPLDLPRIDAEESVIYAPECVVSIGPFAGALDLFGQPELTAFVANRFAGTSFDRRHQTDTIYEDFLKHAERRGVLRRRI
ncbi:MAG: alkaline phosphatase family protein [Deltaproteobacteria bacterium]